MIGRTETFETITPGKAVAWLTLARPKPKRPSPLKVDSLAYAIGGGFWNALNGASIKFADNGQLVDGRARLLAIAQAGKAVQSLIVRGVPIEEIEAAETPPPADRGRRGRHRKRAAG